jgi:alpha-galactosidase
MKWLRLCAAFAVVAAASAQNITGTWEARYATVDEARKVVLGLTVQGGKVTGYMTQPNGSTPIVDGTVDGATITLVTERPGRGGFGAPPAAAPAGRGAAPAPAPAPAPQRTTYTARLQGGKLILERPGRGGANGPAPWEFTQTSTAPPAPLPPTPAKVTLTSYQPVPYNGLAKTPPMGWNSWNKFAERVTDKDVRGMADAMASNGMKAAGYTYINIDDTWELDRDANGVLRTNSKFPDMKALSDYVHSKGLKLGIYSSPGPKTCAGYEGTYNHELQDAKQYVAWGIDYLKYDWCSASQVYDTTPENGRATMEAAYAKMGAALLEATKNSPRKIVYSLCQYGNNNVGEWGAKVGGNLWRTTGDINDSWQSMMNLGFNMQVGREKFSNPGHWNDPDMLEIGNGHMTDVEYQTHMSLWSLLAAPLLAGNDLRDMKPSILEILTNKEVIAVDQDKLGKQAVRVAPPVPAAESESVPKAGRGGSTTGGLLQVFARPLADGGHAVGLFNLGTETAKVTAKWSDIGIKGSHKVRDLWKHADLGSIKDEFTADVPSHGVVMIKIAK